MEADDHYNTPPRGAIPSPRRGPLSPSRGRPPSRRRKAYGQNFLRSQPAADRIVEIFGPRPGGTVLEIGPGEGVLTGRLLDRGAVVVAVERDERLAEELQRRLAGREGFHLLVADARKVELEPLLAPRLPPGGRARVLSNLPYSVGTEILIHLLRHPRLLESLTVMLQREVADRICAAHGGRIYGSLSVLSQYYTEPRRVMTLEPGSFSPPPAVRSALIHMPFRDARGLPREREDEYAAFVHAAFRSRRRTLANNLAPVWGCDASEAAARIRAAGIDPGARPEALGRESFLAVFLAGSRGL